MKLGRLTIEMTSRRLLLIAVFKWPSQGWSMAPLAPESVTVVVDVSVLLLNDISIKLMDFYLKAESVAVTVSGDLGSGRTMHVQYVPL